MRSFWAPMGIAIAVITLAAVPWRPGGGAKRLYSVAWDNTGYSRELSVIDDRLLPSSAERAQ